MSRPHKISFTPAHTPGKVAYYVGGAWITIERDDHDHKKAKEMGKKILAVFGLVSDD